MFRHSSKTVLMAAALSMMLATSCGNTDQEKLVTVGNPYLPLWEHIPDGEPYIFEDPDNPGEYRVYVYGSHDSMITGYCGRELVVWSASVDNLNEWRYDGEILRVLNNANGEPLSSEGLSDVLYAPDVTEKIEPDGTKMYYLFPNDMEYGRRSLIAKALVLTDRSRSATGARRILHGLKESLNSIRQSLLTMTEGCMATGDLNVHMQQSLIRIRCVRLKRVLKSSRT